MTRAKLTRAQKRKIIIIAVLVLLLALLGAYYLYYRSTQQLALDVESTTSEAIDPPQYLYSFNGGETAALRMQRPVGVLADGDTVYVVDSLRHSIDVFNLDGDYQRSFGASDTIVPLYIAKNPTNGNLYVSDRRARSVHIFSPDGKYLEEFDPDLPDDELPDYDTGGVQWAPVALAFGPDGTLYATEILNGHRLLIFGPDGAFKRSVGTAGTAEDVTAEEGVFQFPNGIAVSDGLVYVTDSNNRRVQVFDAQGNFKRIIVTQGLPRGISFLGKLRSDEASSSTRFVVVDTLAHDGTIWTSAGQKIVNFGQKGLLEGQFAYPNGVSVGLRNKIFIADTSNGRVQVWGWPEEASVVPLPPIPQNWPWCLVPLLLLPLLILLRKKRFFATADFVLEMYEANELELMPDRRRKWLVTAEDYEALKGLKQGEVDLGELLNETEYSQADVQALMEKLEIPEGEAIRLVLAKRAHIFATENEDLRRLAKTQEIDVVNRIEFLERYAKRDAGRGESSE